MPMPSASEASQLRGTIGTKSLLPDRGPPGPLMSGAGAPRSGRHDAPREWRAPSGWLAQTARDPPHLARGGDPHRDGADRAEGDAEHEGDGVGAGPVVQQAG